LNRQKKLYHAWHGSPDVQYFIESDFKKLYLCNNAADTERDQSRYK